MSDIVAQSNFPDGSAPQTRLRAVMCHEEEGRWKLVHMHLSRGVPGEEVVELQHRWRPKGSAGRANFQESHTSPMLGE